MTSLFFVVQGLSRPIQGLLFVVQGHFFVVKGKADNSWLKAKNSWFKATPSWFKDQSFVVQGKSWVGLEECTVVQGDFLALNHLALNFRTNSSWFKAEC